MKLYKYVNNSLKTSHNGYVCEWGVGIENSIQDEHSGIAPFKICSRDVYHAFIHPLIGELCLKVWSNPPFFMTAIYDKYSRLLEVEGIPVVASGLNKVGCRSMKVVKELRRPLLSQRASYLLWWVTDTFLSHPEENFWREGYFRSPRHFLDDALNLSYGFLSPREKAMRSLWTCSSASSPSYLSPVDTYTYRLWEAFPTKLTGYKDSLSTKAEIERLVLLQRILDEVVRYDSQHH